MRTVMAGLLASLGILFHGSVIADVIRLDCPLASWIVLMQESPYAPPKDATLQDVRWKQSTARPTVARVLGAASLLTAALFVLWAILLSSGASIFLVVILGLIASPYLLLWLACRALTGWAGMALIAITLAGCSWVGVDAFDAVDEDAQGGLNLVFIPIFQLGGVFLSVCLALFIDWAGRKFWSAV